MHRAPGATDWEVWDLDKAMERVAELVKKTRDETFIEKLEDSRVLNMTPAIFSLGGATLDNAMIVLALCAGLLATGCGSPEARRTRSGGPGDDVGNRSRVVQMHEGSRPYWTPELIAVRHPPLDPARQAEQLSGN